jgi:tripartite ATP-independent transporter DctM subunit
MCVCLAFVAWLVAVKRGYPSEPFPGLSSLAVSFIVALPGLLTAVIIVGGVLSGIMTVTESGAFGAIYAIAVTALVYRELTWEKFRQAVLVSVRITSMAMVLIACASAFAYLLTLNRVPELLASFVLSFSDSKFVILMLLNCTFLLLGMIMDMAALILITTPIFLPIVMDLGMSPIQFGIIMMMNLGLGLTTPPVGACLFVGCVVGNERMENVVKTIWPFYLAILFALLLVTYVPAISLGLGWIITPS